MSADSGNFFKGFLIGGAFGVLAGVLFAPKAGKDIREDLFSDSDDILNKAKSELDKIREELVDLKEKVSKKSTATKPSQTPEERDFEARVNSLDDEDQTTTIHSKKSSK